jgi:hypothetical protein
MVTEFAYKPKEIEMSMKKILFIMNDYAFKNKLFSYIYKTMKNHK